MSVGALAALALHACSGPPEVSLGGAGMVTTNAAFLSPKGNDQNPGSRELPWKTFAAALGRLGPGSTLTLLADTYDGGSTGYLDARCVAGPRGPANAKSGTDDTDTGRILVKADLPGSAFLRGDANGPPLSIEGCSHWAIDGLRVESADLATAPTTPEGGSVVVVGNNTTNLVLSHLLLVHANRYRHSHLIHIADGSHDILVEDSELYDFHENAVETARTSALTFRRNYVNSRGAADIDGGFKTGFATGGDFAFFFEETAGVIAENNVVENAHDGFAIVGRDNGLDSLVPPPNPPDGNRLLGNIVLQPDGVGIRIDSRCNHENPCPPSRTIRRTELVDDAVISATAGLSSAGAMSTTVQRLTVTGASDGVLFIKEPQNGALQSSSTTTNSLAIVQDIGFRADNEMGWSFDHCAVMTSVPTAAYVPDDPAHVTGKVTVTPDLGACLVFIPEASALKHAGTGSAVGADILDRYEGGVLTSMPLWASSGAFPCGAAITEINSDTLDSCVNVHKRLNIVPAGTTADATHCPLP
jgi:hypothetical protein